MERGGCVYIMTNVFNNIYYTRVTSELRNRTWEHKKMSILKVSHQSTNVINLSIFNFFPILKKLLQKKNV